MDRSGPPFRRLLARSAGPFTLALALAAPHVARAQGTVGTGPALTKEETLNYINVRLARQRGSVRPWGPGGWPSDQVIIERVTVSLNTRGELIFETVLRRNGLDDQNGSRMIEHVRVELCEIATVSALPAAAAVPPGPAYPAPRLVIRSPAGITLTDSVFRGNGQLTESKPSGYPQRARSIFIVSGLTDAQRIGRAILHLRDLCKAEDEQDPFAG